MVTTTKLASGTNINASASWSNGVPTAADDAVWNSTSLGGTLTGNSASTYMKSLTINGATANIVFNNTVQIVTGNGGAGSVVGAWNVTLASSNNRTVTFGLNNPSFTVFVAYNTNFYLNNVVTLRSASIGSGGSFNGIPYKCYIYNTNPLATSIGNSYFLLDQPGTLVYTDITADFYDYTGLAVSRTSVNTGAGPGFSGTLSIKGMGCQIWGTVNNAVLGGAIGSIISVENHFTLGSSGFSFSLPTTDLQFPSSTTMYQVTLGGNVSVGSVTSPGAAGFKLNATNSRYQLSAPGGYSNKPAFIANGLFLSGTTFSTISNRYRPTILFVDSGGSFGYLGADSTFNFPCTPQGTGAVTIYGNYSGTGCVFTAGQLTNFEGTIRVAPYTAAGYEAPKISISELPLGNLGWMAYGTSATASTGTITYTGAGESKGTGLVIDSWSNTGATVGSAITCSLLSSGSGPIALSGPVSRTDSGAYAPSQAMTLTLGGTNTGDNTLSGNITESSVNDILNISKVDTGRWIFSGNNSYTGSHSISAGTLSAQSATALGSATSTGVTITGSGILELSGGFNFNKSGTPFTLRAGNSIYPSISSLGDNTLTHGAMTLVATTAFPVSTGNRLALRNGVISGAFGLTKWRDGELDLGSAAHTYTGAVTLDTVGGTSGGTLTVANLKDSGTASSLGTGSGTSYVAIWSTSTGDISTLKYNGVENTSTNRPLYFRSGGVGHRAALDASGDGYVWYTSIYGSGPSSTGGASGHKTILTGTSTADNRITANISILINIEKTGTGTWSLTGNLSPFNGLTTYLTSLRVSLGRLNLTGAVQLLSSSSVTVSGGALKVSTTNGNTMACPVTVDAGANLELETDTLPSTSSTTGRVIGTGAVSVSGTVKTFKKSTQKGQMRYGGNLTLSSGAVIEIGSL